MVRPQLRWCWLLLAAVGGLAGCSEGEREECVREDEGEFFFSVTSSPTFPAGSDSLANLAVTLQNVVVDSVGAFPNFVQPILFYRFHATGYSRVDITLDDLLLHVSSDPRDRGFPVVKGDSLTSVTIEMTRRLVPASMGIRISDAGGMRYLGINDWRPAGDPAARVFQDGYGDLDGQGELRAILSDPGCEDRNDDPQCYFEVRNLQLDFLIGGLGPYELMHPGDRREAGWRLHVHKAARMVATTSCGLEALERQNAVSFFVEREGSRTP